MNDAEFLESLSDQFIAVGDRASIATRLTRIAQDLRRVSIRDSELHRKVAEFYHDTATQHKEEVEAFKDTINVLYEILEENSLA